MQGLMQIDGFMQALGKERVFGIMNEVFRLSGAHDLLLETDEADQQQDLGNMQNEQFLGELKQQWPQVLQAVQKLMQLANAPQAPQAPQAQPPMPPPEQQAQTSPNQQVQL
jgi:hypothetical protein